MDIPARASSLICTTRKKVESHRPTRGKRKDKDVRDMADINNTQFFNVNAEPETRAKMVLDIVYSAMAEKGYNPVNQMVGYIMSGDPTYITSYKNARSLIMKVERDELVEELLKEYIRNKSWQMK